GSVRASGRGVRLPGADVDEARAAAEALVQRDQRARARVLLRQARGGGQELVALARLQRDLEDLRDEVDRGLGVALRERVAREAREVDVEPEDRQAQEVDLVDLAVRERGLDQRAARLAAAAPVGVLDLGAVDQVRARDALGDGQLAVRQRLRRRTVLGAL